MKWEIINDIPYPRYDIRYTESTDGISWIRMDNKAVLLQFDSGWDSHMACYPAILEIEDKTYMFYDGNGMGETGFGYVELIENETT